MIVWINGAFGSGKTTVAHLLAAQLEDANLYDPEKIGSLLMESLPSDMQPSDFQHYPEWRQWNIALLQKIAQGYTGTLIVPMTLYNKAYYDEIMGGLTAAGIQIQHVQLEVSKVELIRRLTLREKENPANLEWGIAHIDPVLSAFHSFNQSEKISNEGPHPQAAVTQILAMLPELSKNLGSE